jgi:diacylglycerol kinase family enzyme
MDKTIGVIINAGSGPTDAEQKITTLRAAFSQHQLSPDFLLVHPGSSISEVTRKAIDSDHNIIAVAGGDGTINGVASELLNTDVCLGILPSGTFNHLAQDLNIPLELTDAVAVLANGIHKKIDVARVNDKTFLNNSSIGLYSKLVVYRESNQKHGLSKKFALVKSILSVFWNYSFLNVEIEVDGKTELYKTPLAFVGNNLYQVEGLNIGTRTQLDAGKLCLYIIKHSGRLDLVKLGLHSLFKQLYNHDQFDAFAVNAVKLQTRKPVLKVAIDGEIVSLPSPLYYSIKPKALCVLVPGQD